MGKRITSDYLPSKRARFPHASTKYRINQKIKKKRAKKPTKKIHLKPNLNVSIAGININYKMYQQLLASVIEPSDFKIQKPNLQNCRMSLETLNWDVDEIKRDILKYFAPLQCPS